MIRCHAHTILHMSRTARRTQLDLLGYEAHNMTSSVIFAHFSRFPLIYELYIEENRMFEISKLGRLVLTILLRQKLKALPEHSSLDTLCSSLSKYFTYKNARIRSNFVVKDNDYDFPEPPLSENTLQCFTPATTNEVFNIITKSPNKSCDLDPFPTLLLKKLYQSTHLSHYYYHKPFNAGWSCSTGFQTSSCKSSY